MKKLLAIAVLSCISFFATPTLGPEHIAFGPPGGGFQPIVGDLGDPHSRFPRGYTYENYCTRDPERCRRECPNYPDHPVCKHFAAQQALAPKAP